MREEWHYKTDKNFDRELSGRESVYARLCTHLCACLAHTLARNGSHGLLLGIQKFKYNKT